MYVKYTWLSTATEAQVRSDIISLMTGNTTISTLSASCDKTNTAITSNTTPTNWTVYDTAPAASQGSAPLGTSQVLQSLNLDGTTYKYAQVILNAGSLSILGWENWNNTAVNTAAGAMYPGAVVLAHGGFNCTSSQGGAIASGPMTITYTQAGSIYIFSTPRYLITAYSPIVSPYIGGCAVVEFSRTTNSLDITYPCHATLNTSALSNSATQFGLCRIKKPTAAGDYGQSLPGLTTNGTNLANGSFGYSNIFTINSAGGGNSIQQNSPTLGVGENAYILTLPIIIAGSVGVASGIILGTVQGGLLTMPAAELASNQIDQMSVGGVTYVIIKCGNSLPGNAANTYALLVPAA